MRAIKRARSNAGLELIGFPFQQSTAMKYALILLLLAGCASEQVWMPPPGKFKSVSEAKQAFMQTRYRCVKKSTYVPTNATVNTTNPRGSGDRFNRGLSRSSSKPKIDDGRFTACMQAAGYELKSR